MGAIAVQRTEGHGDVSPVMSGTPAASPSGMPLSGISPTLRLCPQHLSFVAHPSLTPLFHRHAPPCPPRSWRARAGSEPGSRRSPIHLSRPTSNPCLQLLSSSSTASVNPLPAHVTPSHPFPDPPTPVPLLSSPPLDLFGSCPTGSCSELSPVIKGWWRSLTAGPRSCPAHTCR